MLFLVSVLQYEPNNATAKEFYPFIVEKLHLSKYSFTVPDCDKKITEACVCVCMCVVGAFMSVKLNMLTISV